MKKIILLILAVLNHTITYCAASSTSDKASPDKSSSSSSLSSSPSAKASPDTSVKASPDSPSSLSEINSPSSSSTQSSSKSSSSSKLEDYYLPKLKESLGTTIPDVLLPIISSYAEPPNRAEFFKVIKEGDFKKLTKFLLDIEKINLKDPSTLEKEDEITELARLIFTGKTGLLEYATSHGFENITKLFLDLGADVNATNPEGRTPLRIAANLGNETIVKLLLDYGADVNAKDNYEMTPLIGAIRKEGNETIIKLLLDNDADVNVEDEKGFTPLMAATDRNQKTVVKLLLDNVNMNMKNVDKALQLAENRNKTDIIPILKEYKSKKTKSSL